MTTQDQRSDVTGSYDQQPQVAVSETQPQTQPWMTERRLRHRLIGRST